MKVAHLNVRSLLTGFDELCSLIAENNFDVIMLTETWLNDNISTNVLNIPGYYFYHKDRLGRGGGVGAYVRCTLKHSTFDFNFQISEQLEHIFLKICLPNKKIIIGTFYRPPNTNINNMIVDFENILSDTFLQADVLLYLGDFNINFFNLSNPIMDTFESYGLQQLIDEPTRVTQSSSTLIDPIFINTPDLVTRYGTASSNGISDHNLVYVDMSLNIKKPPPRMFSFRSFKNFNQPNFEYDLLNIPWHRIFQERNIETKIELFNQFIIELFDAHAPMIEVRATKPKAPWLNDEIRRLKTLRDKCWQKFKKSRTEDEHLIYKNIRNQTLSAIRTAKKTHIVNISQQNNTAKLWKTLQTLNIRSQKNDTLPVHLSNPNEINTYFTSFLQSVSNFPNNKISFYNNNLFNPENEFNFSLATLEEIHSALHNIRTNAVGVDTINAKMLKICSPFIDHIILHLVNSAIENKQIPTIWKTALGIPLPKNSQPSHFSELRIISILPTISKILERILYNQIFNYFTVKKIIPDKQCGFRKNFSTISALATVLDDIFGACDEGRMSILVLLDFSKAFDTLDHRLMLAKLKYYGFDIDSIQLISSYLNNRSQKVVYNNVTSNGLNILSGVPQGAILSPLLFIIYTIDIILAPNHCQTQAYADDTQLYFSFDYKKPQDAAAKINADLQIIKELSAEHNLNLNSDKTKLLCMGSKIKRNSIKNNFNLKIDNSTLNFVSSARNLGLTIDEDLRFSEHVQNITRKSFCALKLLYNNRHILNFLLKKTLCDSLVLSHFNYADFIYGPCLTVRDKQKLQKVQNACCRLMYGIKKYEHISHKIIESNWLNMENRRKLHLSNFVHKLLNTTNTSDILKNKFMPRTGIHKQNIRNKNKFTIPPHKTSMYKRSFSYNAINLYNFIPDDFKTLNINKFKYKVRQFLIGEQI